MNGLNSRADGTKKTSRELEDGMTETTKFEQKENRLKKS